MKKIYIRVDGNEIIATGHVMRCLSVAEQLRKNGVDVCFLFADERPAELVSKKGFSYEVLGSTWNDLDQEIAVVQNFFQTQGSSVQDSVLLLDTYYVTPKYLEQVSRVVKICYVDDINMFPYKVHTIINYNWIIPFDYEHKDVADYIKPNLLLGASYVPLREEFSYQKYVVSDTVKKVLITTGGTDQLNMAGGILNKVLETNDLDTLEYHVIVGGFNQNKEMLQLLAKEHSNVILHENVTNMSYWMRECDVAISAGGSTTYELCACGVPSICFEIAENQRGSVIWQDAGYMRFAGNGYLDYEACVDGVAKHLTELLNDKSLRTEMSEKMQTLVDGEGARRIAEYIMNVE